MGSAMKVKNLSHRVFGVGTTEGHSKLSAMIVSVALVVSCGGTQKSASDARLTNKQRQCIEEANAKPKPADNPPESITIARVLVRHAELSDPQGATRSRGEACVRALEAREELRDGTDWEDVVKIFSDDHRKPDGDLGRVARKDVEPKLARAAFALEAKELSYVVETDEGFQIVLRTH